MKKQLPYYFFTKIIILFFYTTTILTTHSCTYPSQTLEGKWERFGDPAKTSQLEVICKNDTCKGFLIKIEGSLNESGFAINDIKWDKITKINDKEYEGKDLVNLVNSNGIVEKQEYLDMKILFVSDDILYIHSEADHTKVDTTEAGYKKDKTPEQKWKRIR